MKYSFLIGLFLYAITINAQKVTPQLLSSSGSITENAEIKISWTVGEFAIATIGTNPKLTQGFQQSKLTFETNVEDVFFANRIKVYPNPSEHIINIELKEFLEESTAELTDAIGNIISRISFTQSAQIDIRDLPAGVYYIHVQKNSKLITTTKIIKL